jgi:ubiquinone/menaquinone biosynthesis C-methylase UbiE
LDKRNRRFREVTTPEEPAPKAEHQAIAYYEKRYALGYMEDWPPERKQRITDVVRSLKLPAAGEAIDFGCGNGVLTDVLRQALPGWNIIGIDISPTAVNNARMRFPACTFYVADTQKLTGRRFDLLFTHHVLEHVIDLKAVLEQMSRMLKPVGGMLHILPCGNPGSFEHEVCLLRQNGIDHQRGGRFFFEDPSHLRRLTSAQLNGMCRTEGFVPDIQYYGNQYFGALRWITESLPLIGRFADPAAAEDLSAAKRLQSIRFRLFVIALLRAPAFRFDRALRLRRRSSRHLLLLLLGLPLYPISKIVELLLSQKAAEEWREQRHVLSGSEMYLFFRRTQESAQNVG